MLKTDPESDATLILGIKSRNVILVGDNMYSIGYAGDTWEWLQKLDLQDADGQWTKFDATYTFSYIFAGDKKNQICGLSKGEKYIEKIMQKVIGEEEDWSELLEISDLEMEISREIRPTVIAYKQYIFIFIDASGDIYVIDLDNQRKAKLRNVLPESDKYNCFRAVQYHDEILAAGANKEGISDVYWMRISIPELIVHFTKAIEIEDSHSSLSVANALAEQILSFLSASNEPGGLCFRRSRTFIAIAFRRT